MQEGQRNMQVCALDHSRSTHEFDPFHLFPGCPLTQRTSHGFQIDGTFQQYAVRTIIGESTTTTLNACLGVFCRLCHPDP